MIVIDRGALEEALGSPCVLSAETVGKLIDQLNELRTAGDKPPLRDVWVEEDGDRVLGDLGIVVRELHDIANLYKCNKGRKWPTPKQIAKKYAELLADLKSARQNITDISNHRAFWGPISNVDREAWPFEGYPGEFMWHMRFDPLDKTIGYFEAVHRRAECLAEVYKPSRGIDWPFHWLVIELCKIYEDFGLRKVGFSKGGGEGHARKSGYRDPVGGPFVRFVITFLGGNASNMRDEGRSIRHVIETMRRAHVPGTRRKST